MGEIVTQKMFICTTCEGTGKVTIRDNAHANLPAASDGQVEHDVIGNL